MRKEFAETILELQKEIIDLKEKAYGEEKINSSEEGVEEISREAIETDTEKESVYNGVKVNDIQKLYAEGYSLEEISEKLGISKGRFY